MDVAPLHRQDKAYSDTTMVYGLQVGVGIISIQVKGRLSMDINYKAMNDLTLASDMPMPPIQSISKVLWVSQYSSTLDFEVRFHRIRLAT